MKMMMTTLAACTLAVGVAHANDTNKQTTPSTGAGATTTAPSTTTPPVTNDNDVYGAPSGTLKQGTGTGTGVANESAPAGWPSGVTVLSVEQGKRTEASGSLSMGTRIEDLALPGHCLGENAKEHFQSNQVLYGFTLPANTDVKIKVLPKDVKQPLSIYAYTLPTTRFDLPQKTSWNTMRNNTPSSGAGSSYGKPSGGTVSGVDIDCKTSIGGKTAIGKAVKGDERVIQFDGKKEARNVIIGVSAPAGTTSEDFLITIEGNKD